MKGEFIMGDKHEKKAYYKRRDGRPEMKYQGIMGVTLFLMVLLTGICLVYVFWMLRVAPEKVSASKEIVEEEMFRLELGKMGSFSNLSSEMLGTEAAKANPKAVWYSYGIAMLINKLPPMAIYFMVCKKYHSLCCPDEGAFFKNHREICSKNWNCFNIYCK